MRKLCKLILVLFSVGLVFTSGNVPENNKEENWPTWRGAKSNGVSLTATPPTNWSESENVKWKIPIPGKGLGTPVIWGNQIFITTAIELDEQATEEAIKRIKKNTPSLFAALGMLQTTKNLFQFVVYSINRETGEITWQKTVREQFPHEGVHGTSSWASASCVTDGEHLIAHFGSYGTYCFNLQGELLWEKDFGDMKIEMTFGEGTSPVLYKDKLIVVWDHEGQSKLFLVNKNTGEEIWQIDRNEDSNWATPIVAEVNNESQIVVPGYNNVISYQLKDGSEIWKSPGLGDGIIPSPVINNDLVYVMTGYPPSKLKGLHAINLKEAKGEVNETNALKWKIEKSTSYVPSPVLSNDKIYFLKASRAQLSCLNANTGEIYYEAVKPEGMRGGYASPIIANGFIYILDRSGNCAVIKEGEKFELLGINKLNDNFDASPAAAGNDLILRGFENLYCISK